MYNSSEMEKLWFLYKAEGEPKGISINSFCMQQGVSYTQFNDWFRKTHKNIVPVQIEGMPEGEAASPEPDMQDVAQLKHSTYLPKRGNIMVTIQTRDGLHIRKTNLDYQGLKSLVEKLEDLC
ncbi:hypothetical protein [uncultured Bacteroides sp.]|uniref:hypothetical protein n=1 Tax=uncultured Bacteroides sp. TaxID=162156 RepID=UPI002620DEDE|nr:hypothetical protein [uncultured Bacteroides sp.]